MSSPLGSNPYIGPRPFNRQEAGLYFGREREARDLLSLVIAERVVMFYAQSGAGKSSLVNARLIPDLEKKGFEVLPVGRVSGASLDSAQVPNVFALHLMASLHQAQTAPPFPAAETGRPTVSPGATLPPALPAYTQLSLAQFLSDLMMADERWFWAPPSSGSSDLPVLQPALQSDVLPKGELPGTLETMEICPRALIIDQFEEIFTNHLEAWEQRTAFFQQLAEALEADPYLWLVLVLREDFVAELDPYAYLLPGALRARFYMQRMGEKDALAGIEEPARLAGRPMAPGVAQKLVDNLRLLTSAEGVVSLGQFVEPVQLQVVCYQLWENLANSPAAGGVEITDEDLTRLARGQTLAQFVNSALAGFYEQALVKVIKDAPGLVDERKLREWFSQELITEASTRGFVYQGETHTAGLPNAAVRLLEAQFILRCETKAGGKWYELVHDRFVQPILNANQAWEQVHQRPVAAAAEAWEKAGRDPQLLYDGQTLRSGLADLNTAPTVFSPLEKEFLQASSAADQKRVNRRRQAITAIVAVVILVESIAIIWALWQTRQSLSAQALSSTNMAVAMYNLDVAGTNAAVAWGESTRYSAQATRSEELRGAAVANANSAATSAAQAAENARDAEMQRATAWANATEIVNSVNRLINGRVGLMANQLATSEAQVAGLQMTIAAREGNPYATPTPWIATTATPDTPPAGTDDTPTPVLQFSPTPASPYLTATAAVRNTPTPVLPGGRFSIGYSVEKQAIEAARIGDGWQTVVIVGGLHAGYAPAAVDLAHQVVHYYEGNPQAVPANISLVIIPNANPDNRGEVDMLAGRLNANGVDLARNWDCNWSPDVAWGGRVINSGSGPFSEPETQALRDFILKASPAAVIFLDGSANNLITMGGCGSLSLFSEPLAQAYSAAGYRVGNFAGYGIRGDATSWLDSQGIPAITVFLANHTEFDWNNHLLGLEAVFDLLLSQSPRQMAP